MRESGPSPGVRQGVPDIDTQLHTHTHTAHRGFFCEQHTTKKPSFSPPSEAHQVNDPPVRRAVLHTTCDIRLCMATAQEVRPSAQCQLKLARRLPYHVHTHASLYRQVAETSQQIEPIKEPSGTLGPLLRATSTEPFESEAAVHAWASVFVGRLLKLDGTVRQNRVWIGRLGKPVGLQCPRCHVAPDSAGQDARREAMDPPIYPLGTVSGEAPPLEHVIGTRLVPPSDRPEPDGNARIPRGRGLAAPALRNVGTWPREPERPYAGGFAHAQSP